jgi:transposase
METERRRRRQRQSLTLEELKTDPSSLLSWGIEDPALRKLETYRLYQAGYAAADIAAAFEISREYLYQIWTKFKDEGTTALVDKRWGAEPRKLTSETERAILRMKALNPDLSDTKLGEAFGLDRSSIYRLLKEHGLQDLHRVLADNPSTEAGAGESAGNEDKKTLKSCPAPKPST